MVYSVFDPKLKNQSLGTYMILDHNNLVLEMNLRFVYLGYWVEGNSKMDYKKRFSPLEVFTNDKWVCASNSRIIESGSEHHQHKQGVPIYLPSEE